MVSGIFFKGLSNQATARSCLSLRERRCIPVSVLINGEKNSEVISNEIHYSNLINDTISPQRYFFVLFHQDRNRLRSASLTAEAALVFPIFFFFFYLLWQYFLLLLLQLSVCHTAAFRSIYPIPDDSSTTEAAV